MRIRLPERMFSDADGMVYLTRLADCALRAEEVLEIDVSDVKWIDANPRVAWEVLRCILERRTCRWAFVNGRAPVEFERMIERPTCLPYQKFSASGTDDWAKYVRNVMEHPNMPKMTSAVQSRLMDSILEVFNNSREHAMTMSGIFACGHAYPTQKIIRVSIADDGIGFKERIRKAIGLDMSGEDALSWAVRDGNTVKKDISGGLGLKDLKRFVKVNQGKLSILSDDGYWEFSNGEETARHMNFRFPGSLVTIALRTDDDYIYQLRSEIAGGHNERS